MSLYILKRRSTGRYDAGVTEELGAAQDPRMLIGLADAKKVDKVEARWPGGATTVLENVPLGRYVVVEEPANKPAASAVQRAPVED